MTECERFCVNIFLYWYITDRYANKSSLFTHILLTTMINLFPINVYLSLDGGKNEDLLSHIFHFHYIIAYQYIFIYIVIFGCYNFTLITLKLLS